MGRPMPQTRKVGESENEALIRERDERAAKLVEAERDAWLRGSETVTDMLTRLAEQIRSGDDG